MMLMPQALEKADDRGAQLDPDGTVSNLLHVLNDIQKHMDSMLALMNKPRQDVTTVDEKLAKDRH